MKQVYVAMCYFPDDTHVIQVCLSEGSAKAVCQKEWDENCGEHGSTLDWEPMHEFGPPPDLVSPPPKLEGWRSDNDETLYMIFITDMEEVS